MPTSTHDDGFSQATYEPSSLIDLLRWRAVARPEGWAFTFLEDGETEQPALTYGELDRQARAIGKVLKDRGACGERVLLLYPPGLEYIAAFFGCLYAGAVALPAYPPDPARLNRTLPRLQAMLSNAQAGFALTAEALAPTVQTLLARDSGSRTVQVYAVDGIAGGAGDDWLPPPTSSDALAFLMYTSGSTGMPKGGDG